MKHVSPSTGETAFNCPHCGAMAQQTWYDTLIQSMDYNGKITPIIKKESINLPISKFDSQECYNQNMEFVEIVNSGVPIIYLEEDVYKPKSVINLYVSKCFNCENIAIWIGDTLAYPKAGCAPDPNPDLPEEILQDYREASAILNLSPRGAAALIRLCIQKLCKHLGEPGKNINTDIGSLVAKGLDVRLQRALDAVRVIGNDAVHPGKIDIKDDRATAETLFRLLNLIADKLISEPKHVDEIYGMLPKTVLEAIDKRDGKA